jgi:hypothetical protein
MRLFKPSISFYMKYWEIIAGNPSNAGWSWGLRFLDHLNNLGN